MHALSDQTMVRVSIHLHTELEDILALGEAILACAQQVGPREVFDIASLGRSPFYSGNLAMVGSRRVKFGERVVVGRDFLVCLFGHRDGKRAIKILGGD